MSYIYSFFMESDRPRYNLLDDLLRQCGVQFAYCELNGGGRVYRIDPNDIPKVTNAVQVHNGCQLTIPVRADGSSVQFGTVSPGELAYVNNGFPESQWTWVTG